jgi:hypothetical protein
VTKLLSSLSLPCDSGVVTRCDFGVPSAVTSGTLPHSTMGGGVGVIEIAIAPSSAGRQTLTEIFELPDAFFECGFTELVRTLLRTPALQTEQRAEEPAMGDAGANGRAGELKVKAAHGVRAPGA